jgi:hypothetical protein
MSNRQLRSAVIHALYKDTASYRSDNLKMSQRKIFSLHSLNIF